MSEGLSRRDVLRVGIAGAMLPLAPLAHALAPPPAQGFRWAYFSDTHVGLRRNLAENRAMLAEIVASRPAFAVNVGDVTDYGWLGEYSNYTAMVKELGFPVHDVPGNHDVRWSPLGMQVFRAHLGRPFRRVDREGVAFFLLDSTVPLSHWGHYETAQLRWLEAELKRLGRAAPAVLASHHWVGRDRVMIDNEDALLPLVAEYNVLLFLTGHGHSDLLWDWGAVQCVMNRGLYQGSYMIVDVDREAGELRISRRTAERPQLEPLVSIPIKAPKAKRPLWRLSAPEITPGAELLVAGASGAQYRWNAGAWMRTNIGRVETAALRPGTHRLSIQAPDGGWIASFPLEVNDPRSRLRREWRRKLSGGIMSQLRLTDGLLVVSCMDGSVHALRRDDGAPRWRAKTEDYCHSSPLIAEDRVVVGSADSHVYAFGLRDGRRLWRTKTGGPVYASAAKARGVVAIASGDGVFYGLDPETGEVRWTTAMPPSNTAFAQSVAATDGERFYFGAWDSHLYALDALTGRLLWRQPCMERTFAFSPAIGGPAVGPGVVIVPANGNGLFCFDAVSGDKRWEVASPGDKYGHSGPRVVGERIYVGCLGNKGEVRCVDLSGQVVWTCATGSEIYDSSPSVADGFVSIGSVDGTFSLIDQATGQLVEQVQMPQGHFLSSPAAEGGWLYAGTFSNEVIGFRLAPS